MKKLLTFWVLRSTNLVIVEFSNPTLRKIGTTTKFVISSLFNFQVFAHMVSLFNFSCENRQVFLSYKQFLTTCQRYAEFLF